MKDHEIDEAYAYGMKLEICNVGNTGKKRDDIDGTHAYGE